MFTQHINDHLNFKLSLATISAILLFLLHLPVNVAALANCPSGCRCDDTTLIVQCGEGELDVLPIALNPSIQRLVIRSNKIKTIDSSIQFYAELTFLDLSSNYLMTIPQRTFAYQKKLQELHLNHNKIGSITNKTFIGLSSLTVLNLRGNLISELHQGSFAPLLKVQELNLGENRISYIDAKAFEGLTQLRILYLDDNTLTSVPDPVILQHLPNLAELFLGMNSLTTIPSEAFVGLKGLTSLNLKGAGLLNISHDSFKGLEALRVLDLSDNRLTRIPTVGLSHLARLEELSLGQNDFEVIAEGAFVGLKQMKRLEIVGALRLKKVLNGAFATNTNLEHLNLSNNKMLAELQEGALSGLPHLENVILKANALTTLAEGLFHWKDLKMLDLSENPIACDCRVMWLRDLLLIRNGSNDILSDIICEFPERLRGEELRNLNPSLIGCNHTDPRKQALIGALLVGSAATITALALVLYRCRRKIRDHLKGGICGSAVLGRKEREYQKTFCDEDYMTRLQHHPCSLGLHSTFPNTYTSHHSITPAHYSMCGMPINDLNLEHQINQKNCFQQLQVPTNTLLANEKKSFMNFGNSNNAASCGSSLVDGSNSLDDSGSSSFVVHMSKSNAINSATMGSTPAQHKLNHYIKPQFLPPTATALVGDSCYSYADIPFVKHKSENGEHHRQQQKQLRLTQDYFTQQRSHYQLQQQQQQQKQQRYQKAQHFLDDRDDEGDEEGNRLNDHDDTTSMDFNYMYSNTHYSLPLEPAIGHARKSMTATATATTTTPIPPALPMRNGTMQHDTIGRRSFNTSHRLSNCNTSNNINSNNNNINNNNNANSNTQNHNNNSNNNNNNNNSNTVNYHSRGNSRCSNTSSNNNNASSNSTSSGSDNNSRSSGANLNLNTMRSMR